VLEGRYVFPLPPDASISRLALWVGKELVEGEVLERKRAAAIFQSIVDDTVRPRDPALLEWVSGSEFSLKIFPIPAKSSRKVILAYNQILPSEGGRARYVYPLSLGADRTASIEDFSISMTAHSTGAAIGDISTSGYPASISTEEGKATINFSSKSFVPSSDFGVSYSSDARGAVRGAAYSPKEGELEGRTKKEVTALRAASAKKKPPPQDGFFAIRLAAELPEGAPLPPHVRRDVALVIDTSHSQSRETFEGEVKIAAGLLRQMDPDEQFVVLACDSACEAYPERGLEKVSDASIDAAEKWLSAKKIWGSSDVAGALLEAAARVKAGGEGQIVYIGDGAATSGELSANSIAARVKPAVAEKRIDLRFMGAGRTVDEVTLGGLARALGAAYERVETGESLASRIADFGMGLRAPVVRALAVEPSPSLRDVYPRELPNLRLGQEVVLFGRLSGEPPADVTLRGEMAGAPYSLKKAIQWDAGAASREPGAGNPLVPRLWAEAKIRELEASGEGKLREEAIDLSMRFHVMARGTALLVLENEQMFAEFGVRRTTLEAEDQSDHAFGASRSAASSAPGKAAAESSNGGADTDPPDPYSAGPTPAPARPAAGGPRAMMRDYLDGYDGGGGGWSMPPRPPPAVHVVEGEDWAKGLEHGLEKLRKAAIDAPKSRRAQVSLIRGLLGRGRFSEALTEAAKLAEADPDFADAHLFVAQAAAGTSDGRRAAMELDTQAELDSRRVSAHVRAARAFELLGDERRACAHWRASMELKPTSDEAIRDALRCRARALDGRDAVLAEATAIPKKGKKVEALIARLQAGEAPRFEPERTGWRFKASVKCEQGVTDVPTVVVIALGGTIYSPWTPGTSPSEPGSVALQSTQDGPYRTLTMGGGDGARCELIVDAHGVVRKTPVSVAGARKVIRTQVQL
jgi:tetratricopeptide (TPR) repeat protein